MGDGSKKYLVRWKGYASKFDSWICEQELEKEIIEKMVEGRLRKEYFQQVVLMQQTFVVDGKGNSLNTFTPMSTPTPLLFPFE